MKTIKKRIAEIILVAPLFAGFLWFSGVVIKTKNAVQTGSMLSPGGANALVTGLFIFIIVYSIFLFFVFWNMHKKDVLTLSQHEHVHGKKLAKSH